MCFSARLLKNKPCENKKRKARVGTVIVTYNVCSKNNKDMRR